MAQRRHASDDDKLATMIAGSPPPEAAANVAEAFPEKRSAIAGDKTTNIVLVTIIAGLVVCCVWLSGGPASSAAANGVALMQGFTLRGNLGSRQTVITSAMEASIRASCTPKNGDGKVVLVTGTGGFVGFHVAKIMRRRGDGVVGLDNFNDYYPISLKRARQKTLEQGDDVFTVDADLNDAAAEKRVLDICQFTHILNLAAQAGVRYASKNPSSYIDSNVAGMTVLLEAIKTRKPMPRLVYASSSSVYGLNTKVPFSEDDVVDRPASLYAATKKSDEMLAHTYNHIYGMATTGLRFFTVYGPWGRPDMAAFAFANKIMQGKQLKIFRAPDGSELERDFTFIDDIAKGTIAAVDHIGPSGEKPAPYKIYNLGNKQPMNVSYLVDLLEDQLGKKAVRKYVTLPETGDVLKTHADITHAHADLGYEPSTSLSDGIRQFIEWYKDYYKDGLDSDMLEYKPM